MPMANLLDPNILPLDPNNFDPNQPCPFGSDGDDANGHWGRHHHGPGHDDGNDDDSDANEVERNIPEPNTPEPNTPEPNNPPPVQYQLTTSVVGGNGALAPASGPQNANAVVTLTATPDAGYQVQAWVGTDNDASTANTNTVTMTGAKTVTVQFQAIPAVQYQLTTSVVGGNGTLSPASGPQNANAVVQLTATPNAGYQVQAWVGTDNDASAANTNTVTMTGAKTVTVQFAQIPPAPPVGDAAAGQALYTQSCQMCHGGPSFLRGRGSLIVTNLGSVNPAMSFMTLTDQQVLDLQAFAATQ
jgi:mono/diheme cytochrome c family protein